MCMLGVPGGLRRVLDLLELMLQMANGTGNWDRSFRRAAGSTINHWAISSAPILFIFLIISHVTTMFLDSSSTNSPELLWQFLLIYVLLFLFLFFQLTEFSLWCLNIQGIGKHPLEHGYSCGLAILLKKIDCLPQQLSAAGIPPVGEGLPEHFC